MRIKSIKHKAIFCNLNSQTGATNFSDYKFRKFFLQEFNQIGLEYKRYKEPEALKLLYGYCKHYAMPRILFTCNKKKYNAEDIFHDIFIILIETIDNFNPAYSFNTWFTNLVHYKCLGIYTALKKESEKYETFEQSNFVKDKNHTEENDYLKQYNEIYNHELGEYLMDIVNSEVLEIKPAHRQVYLDRVFMGMDYQSIADKNKLNISTVKSIIRFCRIRLSKKKDRYINKISNEISKNYTYNSCIMQ